jgi:hypothetical protein
MVGKAMRRGIRILIPYGNGVTHTARSAGEHRPQLPASQDTED